MKVNQEEYYIVRTKKSVEIHIQSQFTEPIIKFQFYHLTTIRKVWKQNKNLILLCYWLRHGIFVQKTTWNN